MLIYIKKFLGIIEKNMVLNISFNTIIYYHVTLIVPKNTIKGFNINTNPNTNKKTLVETS